MALRDTWIDKVNNVDDIDAKDINDIASSVTFLEGQKTVLVYPECINELSYGELQEQLQKTETLIIREGCTDIFSATNGMFTNVNHPLTVIFPSTITKISSDMFLFSSGKITLVFKSEPPTLPEMFSFNVEKIIVPLEKHYEYLVTSNWSNYQERIDSVDSYANALAREEDIHSEIAIVASNIKQETIDAILTLYPNGDEVSY